MSIHIYKQLSFIKVSRVTLGCHLSIQVHVAYRPNYLGTVSKRAFMLFEYEYEHCPLCMEEEHRPRVKTQSMRMGVLHFGQQLSMDATVSAQKHRNVNARMTPEPHRNAV